MENNFAFNREKLYNNIMLSIQELKTAFGPTFVNSTLKRHKEVKKFLLEYDVEKWKEFDKRVEDLNVQEYNNY